MSEFKLKFYLLNVFKFQHLQLLNLCVQIQTVQSIPSLTFICQNCYWFLHFPFKWHTLIHINLRSTCSKPTFSLYLCDSSFNESLVFNSKMLNVPNLAFKFQHYRPTIITCTQIWTQFLTFPFNLDISINSYLFSSHFKVFNDSYICLLNANIVIDSYICSQNQTCYIDSSSFGNKC